MTKSTLTPAHPIRFAIPLLIAGGIVVMGGSIAAAATTGGTSPVITPAPAAHTASVSISADGKTVTSGDLTSTSGDLTSGVITIDPKSTIAVPGNGTGTITKSAAARPNSASVSIGSDRRTVTSGDVAGTIPAGSIGKVTAVAGPAGAEP